jgi:PEP-CTERM motif
MRIGLSLVLFATALTCAGQAAALSTAFTGSLTNTNAPAAPGGRCAPALTVNIGPGFGTASGASNLGSLVPTDSHCIIPPLPTSYFDGQFSFDFSGGDVLVGTYAGSLSATGQPGVFANLQQFLVTGGTGRFANTTGSFNGIGNVVFAPGALPSSFATLSGRLEIGSVPEPSTWVMLISGFALSGCALRRRRTVQCAA